MAANEENAAMNGSPSVSRRTALKYGLAAGAGLALARPVRPARAGEARTLRPRPAQTSFFGAAGPETAIWGYDGLVPGPEIRVRQSELFGVVVENDLPQETTVHWHGIRLPHAMDGVPDLTQPPIQPGARFHYEFRLPDAGTFWYHPHVRSSEQQGRGLYGALIVEEAAPPRVDREVVWVIDDWRLDEAGAIHESFDNPMDLSHAGRLGNVATLNGLDSREFPVRAGERLRLRLINTANARHFALAFAGHEPTVIALDGQPVTPHAPPKGVIVLPPAGRADVILDMAGRPGERYAVNDLFYPRQNFQFLELVYDELPPLRDSPLDAPVALPANPLPEPDLAEAARHEILLGGGAMSGLVEAIYDGRRLALADLARRGKVWALNGIVAHRDDMDPLLVFQRGRSQVLALRNDTAFPHPMHLHGHSFRQLTRNGEPVPHRPWLDTLLVAPDETAEIAFVADNPGDWLFHCHVLEHMQAGMAAVFRVT
jgi:FtsP/CotA-like multicopper oxidase with cupredoxin domain